MNVSVLWLLALFGFAGASNENGKLPKDFTFLRGSDDNGSQEKTGPCEQRVSFRKHYEEYMKNKDGGTTTDDESYNLISKQEIVITSDCDMTVSHEMIDGQVHVYIETKERS